MLKVFIFLERTGVKIKNNYEHFQTNENLNYPYIPIKNQDKIIENDDWPFVSKMEDPAGNFNPEYYLRENFPDYEWFDARWLPIFITTKNQDGSSLCSFFVSDRVNREYGERVKMVKLENGNGKETPIEHTKEDGTVETMGKNKGCRTSAPLYFKSNPPVFDNSINDDTTCYHWVFDLDFWFSYGYIYIHSMRAQKLNVKFLMKETEPVSNWGTDFDIFVNQPNDFLTEFQKTINMDVVTMGDLDLNLLLSGCMSVISAFICNYHTMTKQTILDFFPNELQNAYKKLGNFSQGFPALFDTVAFNDFFFVRIDDTPTGTFNNAKFKSYVKSNGSSVNLDYNRDVWLNYNTKEELTRIVSRKDILIDEYAFRTINNIQPLGAICPVQVMSNLALLSQQGNNFTGNLFKTDGSGTSYYQSKYYKYIDCETLLQQEKYKLSNGMFLYLVLAPEMFINYQNYIVPARTKGKINSNETGTYFAVTNKDNVDNGFLKNIDMKNGSFLIPIPNDYEYLVKDKINDTDFTFSVDTMLSVFGSQISLFSIQVTVPGIDDPVDVQVNPGDFKSNVKNIIMINKTPKILQGIALNTDSQKIDNVSAIISNGAITNVILLAFLNGQKDEGGTNSVSYFPAIYFSDSSAYCAYEINSISAMKDFNISFLDRIYEFVTADFKKGDIVNEPYLLSPVCLSSILLLSKEQGQNVMLTAEKMDLSKFLTDSWSLGLMYNFFGNNVSCKLSFNRLKNKTFVGDEIESDVFFIDKRAIPVMISGSNEQMKQQQMVYNTGINLHQKQFDFTEYWNKKQRSYEVAGNVLNYFGNTLSGAATGMMGGGKIGGMPGAVIGGVAGALGGIFGAVGESVRLDFENKNRIAGLNLERQVFGMKSLAETLQINNLENTKMLDGNTAFIQKCFNPVVSNQEMFYDNFKTLVLIPEQKELVLNHAKLWGRLYPFWSTFDTFDVMESNNFFALDNLSGKDGEYLYEIQKWLDENLKQDWKFADFMSVDSVGVFLNKCFGGMRLYNQVLDDSEALDKKISKAVAKRADDSFCHPKDYWWKGLPRTIDVSNLFNIYNVLTDATKENTYNLQDPIYWGMPYLQNTFAFSSLDPDFKDVDGIEWFDNAGGIVYVVDANDPTIGKYYVNTGATSGNHARGKNIRFPKIIKKDGVDYSSDFTQSDFLGLDAGGDSFAWYCQDTPENFYGFVNLDLSKINTIIVDSDTHEANEFTMSLENNKNVKKLTMFAHVVFIEDSCFKNCALTTITATSGRKYISADHIMNDAFYNCQADVELNGPMIVFGGAFAYTKKIKFNNVAMTIVSDGSDYNGKDVFKNSVTRWSSSTIILSENVGSGCFANATISEGLKEFSMNWSNVITIGAYAFAQSDFTFYSIEITSKMTTISQYAFLEVGTNRFTINKYIDFNSNREGLAMDTVFLNIVDNEENWEVYQYQNVGTRNENRAFEAVGFKTIYVNNNFLQQKIALDVFPVGSAKMMDWLLGTDKSAKYVPLMDDWKIEVGTDNYDWQFFFNNYSGNIFSGTRWSDIFSVYYDVKPGNTFMENFWCTRLGNAGTYFVYQNDLGTLPIAADNRINFRNNLPGGILDWMDVGTDGTSSDGLKINFG